MPVLDPALKLQAVAEALAARLGTIPDVTVYDHEPARFKPPVIMIGVVDLERPGVDDAETEVGKDDWYLTWTVTGYVALQDRRRDLAAARRLVGQMTSAIDTDQTLGGEVYEAKLVEARMGTNEEGAPQRLYILEVEVECLAQLPDPT